MSLHVPVRDRIVAVTGGGSGKPNAGTMNRATGNDFPPHIGIIEGLILTVLPGIGLAYGLLAGQKGAKQVILADLRLTAAAQEAVQSDENLIFQQCDVTKWKDLQDIVDVSLAKLGDVPDIYVASAGVFEPVSTFFLHLAGRKKCRYQGLLSLTSHSHTPISGMTQSLWTPMGMLSLT